MYETDLHLEPNEASDLCPVFDDAVLRERGWDEALLTVMDEAPAEEALALIVHEAGATHGEGWSARRVPLDAGPDEERTEDAEACARHEGVVYVMGSQFGKKSGPLSAKRSWIARVTEAALLQAIDNGTAAPLEVARTRFAITGRSTTRSPQPGSRCSSWESARAGRTSKRRSPWARRRASAGPAASRRTTIRSTSRASSSARAARC
jgi:hypothetical protein